MKLELTMHEAIHLIIGFLQTPVGYWKDIPIEDPAVSKFIEMGYASLDDETSEKYILNEKGHSLLHPYIRSISENFIGYIKENGLECYHEIGVAWFSKEYELEVDTGEALYHYIAFNLFRYNYRSGKFYRKGHWGYYFQEVEKVLSW